MQDYLASGEVTGPHGHGHWGIGIIISSLDPQSSSVVKISFRAVDRTRLIIILQRKHDTAAVIGFIVSCNNVHGPLPGTEGLLRIFFSKHLPCCAIWWRPT